MENTSFLVSGFPLFALSFTPSVQKYQFTAVMSTSGWVSGTFYDYAKLTGHSPDHAV
jgi:hypothetical protein